MLDFLRHAPTIRLAAFLGVFAVLAAWEVLAPRRRTSLGRRARWPANLGVVALNAVVVRLLFPAAAAGAAMFAERRGLGLLHLAGAPPWLALVASVVALDLVVYAQHWLFHRVPVLWRLHRVHHADVDFDVTTGLRFHPLEIVASMLIKMAAIVALGAPPLAALVFEVLLNASAMFEHANVRLGARADRLLRLVLVTPDMHRVHHSVEIDETHSNFGFNVSLWDRLFRTYRASPRAGHDDMLIGLPLFREPREAGLPRLLTQPFREGP
jgi:sterol desaturase/sphingolipid hydroxylase (fatty acid hydroxylase superfamily)